MIIYDISFATIPSITTGRLALFFLIIYSIKKISVYRNLSNKALVFSFFFLVACIQSFFSDDFTMVSRVFWFTIYSFIASLIIAYFAQKNNIYIISVILMAITLQSILIIIIFMNFDLRLMVYDIISIGANFEAEDIYRSIGFTSKAGASLSIIQAFGIIAGLIHLRTQMAKYKILIILAILINLIAVALIGRTGLVLSVMAILYYILFIQKLNSAKSYILILFAVILSFNIEKIIEILVSDYANFSVDYFTNWITKVFTGEDNTVKNLLYTMNFPPITLETIMGTGEIVSMDGDNAAGHDSGYIQTYYSMGLIFSILLYSYIASLLIKNKRFLPNKWGVFLIISVLILEVKEPFIFKYSYPFLVFLMIYYERLKYTKKT